MTDIDTVKSIISRASNPVSFSGAGLSAESGIATFRGNSNSEWSRFNPSELASEQGYLSNPSRVMDWYAERRKKLASANPNTAHNCLAKQRNWIHVTQNVDDLLERAGAVAKNVLHLHGSLLKDHCHAHCGFSDDVDLHNPPSVRSCPSCDSYLRPAVVWFGESLPQATWQRALNAVEQCDVLLVVGTSAQVYPAAGLIDIARQNGASIVINDLENLASGAVHAGMPHADEPNVASSRTQLDWVLTGKATEVLPQLFY